MNNPPIVYRPRDDATPEGELSAVAAVLAFILFESSASKGNGCAITAPDDAKNECEKETSCQTKT